MSVGRICIREVDLVDPDETVQIAARRMHDRNVGCLVVQGANGEPLGIVTDRDIALRVVGEGHNPLTTSVAQVMTRAPDSVPEDLPLEMALSRMRAGPYRRLPVVDGEGRLVGLISLDDILDLLAEEFREVGSLLRKESPRSLATA
jgi:CBS domain-containing protein